MTDDLNLAKIKKHIERFGTGAVPETARDLFQSGILTFDDVVTIIKLVDEHTPRRRHQRGPRLSVETRARRLLGLPEEEAH